MSCFARLERDGPCGVGLLSRRKPMPKSTPRQRHTEGRAMQQFEYGPLTTGPGGKGGKVKSRKQAIAIGLSEAGASRYESRHKNRSRRVKTEHKANCRKT